MHILWECPSARDVWCMGSINIQKSSISSKDFLGVVEDMFRRCRMDELTQFAGIARRVWLRRNEVVHGGSFLHPTIIMQRATRAAEEFANLLQNNKAEARGGRTTECQKWGVPSPGWVKLNWDASIEKEMGRVGYSALVRDERGLVVAAQCKSFSGCLNPVLAEAGAALMAVQMCKSLGFQRVHFEGDTKTVIDDVNSPESDWSSKGMLVEDLKKELQAIPQWRMTSTRREGNKVAHALS
jgi:ribonuclease HI